MLRRSRSASIRRDIIGRAGAGPPLSIPSGGNGGTDPHKNDGPRRRPFWPCFRREFPARKRAAVAVAGILFTGAALTCLRQTHAFFWEYEGPLDHVVNCPLETYHGLFCPAFPPDNDHPDADAITSSECHNTVSGEKTNKLPRMFMIGARDEEDGDTFNSWKQLLQSNETVSQNGSGPVQYAWHLERIRTLNISNRYALSGGATRSEGFVGGSSRSSKNQNNKQYLCRKMKWEHRLFAVYQYIFAELLATYTDEPAFVFVEDDAILKDPNAFIEEICYAHGQRLGFYSLYRSPYQWKGRFSTSCVFSHGTVAFYVRREIMEKIVGERKRGSFCRFPIDMYISKMGPWYASRRDIVGHLDLGRIGST
ncbi:hypothetical protein ACHAWF_010522 [Thalassiosira exigua]